MSTNFRKRIIRYMFPMTFQIECNYTRSPAVFSGQIIRNTHRLLLYYTRCSSRVLRDETDIINCGHRGPMRKLKLIFVDKQNIACRILPSFAWCSCVLFPPQTNRISFEMDTITNNTPTRPVLNDSRDLVCTPRTRPKNNDDNRIYFFFTPTKLSHYFK